MKKKVFVFTLLLVAFTFGFAYAEGDAVDMADVKENKYRIGNIAKETKNYIVLVKNREIRKAIRTFDNILVLQEEQLELLHIINGNVNEVKVILENA